MAGHRAFFNVSIFSVFPSKFIWNDTCQDMKIFFNSFEVTNGLSSHALLWTWKKNEIIIESQKKSFWFVISWLLENSLDKTWSKETLCWWAKIRKLIIRDCLIMVSELKKPSDSKWKGCVNFYQASFFTSFLYSVSSFNFFKLPIRIFALF